jgi:hypothetical protein
MSLASNAVELRHSLLARIEKEWRPDAHPTFDDLCIGYIWLNYKRGKIRLDECLRFAGQQADAGISSLDCEQFYELLNRRDAGEPASQIELLAQQVFAVSGKSARDAWDAIASTTALS